MVRARPAPARARMSATRVRLEVSWDRTDSALGKSVSGPRIDCQCDGRLVSTRWGRSAVKPGQTDSGTDGSLVGRVTPAVVRARAVSAAGVFSGCPLRGYRDEQTHSRESATTDAEWPSDPHGPRQFDVKPR